jgi:hypothetical protein
VAKKVRTPPPPRRPVQAPQRRDTRRKKPAAADRGRLLWILAVVVLVAVAAIGAALYFGLRGGGGTKTGKNYNTLPGIRRTRPPWPLDLSHLDQNLAGLDLKTTASHLGLQLHFHAHLDVFVDGKRVTVPAFVGIGPGGGYLGEMHTHIPNGVLHIESPEKGAHFVLGQFFGEWAVYLDSRCIGSVCGLKWYVNGVRQTGNPADLELKMHQEIAIVAGKKPPKKIPSSYKFSPGE